MAWRHKDPRPTSWIGWLFEWCPGRSRCAVPALALTLLIVLVGLLVAALGGFGHRYVRTPQVWALAALTAWVLAWGAWSTRELRDLPDKIRLALRHPNDEDYRRLADRFRERVMRTWPNLLLWAALFGAFLWRVWFETHWLTYFPESWDDGDLFAKRAVLTIFFAVGLVLTVTMFWGFGHYAHFTWTASRESLALPPNLARTHLRPITSFGLAAGLGWSGAVTIAALFFARNVTLEITGLLIVLGLMGLTLIVMPQLFAHGALARTRDELTIAAADPLRADHPSAWVDRFVVKATPETHERRRFLTELNEAPTWIYMPAEGLVFVGEFLVPVTTLILTMVLAE
jgi:hypothetical protein